MKLVARRSFKDKPTAYRAAIMVAASASILDGLITLFTLGWVKTNFQAACLKLQLRSMEPTVRMLDEQTFHNLRTLYLTGMALTVMLVWFTDINFWFILPLATVTALVFYVTATFGDGRPS